MSILAYWIREKRVALLIQNGFKMEVKTLTIRVKPRKLFEEMSRSQLERTWRTQFIITNNVVVRFILSCMWCTHHSISLIEKIKIDPTPYILEEKLSLAIIAIRGLGVRVYLFRRPGLPGEGVLKNRTSIAISNGILLINRNRRAMGI